MNYIFLYFLLFAFLYVCVIYKQAFLVCAFAALHCIILTFVWYSLRNSLSEDNGACWLKNLYPNIQENNYCKVIVFLFLFFFTPIVSDKTNLEVRSGLLTSS